MTVHFGDYTIDPDDPRAPPQEVWDKMTPAEREATVQALPVRVPVEMMSPEGDPHRLPKDRVTRSLDSFFKRAGRQVYVSSELLVYYPNSVRFVPDVLVVRDVPVHDRNSWVVSAEGKGLDLVFEVHATGQLAKDFERKRKIYESVGIPEYFLLDRAKYRLFGWRLEEPGDRTYTPIIPQHGRYYSRVLEMELTLLNDRVSFFYGTATVPDPVELVELLENTVHEVEMKRQAEFEAKQIAQEEQKRAQEERKRAQEEQKRLAAERDEALARARELEEKLRKLTEEKA